MPVETADEVVARGRAAMWPVWLMWLIILLGLGFDTLNRVLGDGSGASALWWLDPLLLAGFAAGLWLRGRYPHRWPRVRLPERPAAVFFIGGSWLTGMLYELSLRTGPTGFGGMHPETGLSFLLAQGHYIPFAVGGWWLARRYGYSLTDVFWTGALASLYELVTAGGPAMAAAGGLWPLTPLLAGYYLYVYALILTMPLLFLDERSLWRDDPRPITAWGKAWRAALFGLLYWVIFVGWAAALGLLAG
jgi:hypothetical protein